jgi:hypothetical protein
MTSTATKGRSLRRAAALVLGAGALVILVTAPTASAVQSSVSGEVLVDRGGTVVTDHSNSSTNCNFGDGGTSCTVSVTLNTRDYNRFVRWCGSTGVVVIIPAGDVENYTKCQGPGAWAIVAWGFLNGGTNTSDVHVGVLVTT